MRSLAIFLLALLLAPAAPRAAVTAPVVVELFQSQGCSSCPPANANLNLLADRPGVLALSFAVDYWDDLGWKDTFARKAFTQRQWDYARGLSNRNVATPQMVINGARESVGNDRRALDRQIEKAQRPTPVVVSARSASLPARAALSKPAEVWLVRFDPRVRAVAVKRGENNGKTLPHRNIVTDLAPLGRWSGAAQTFALPPPSDPALKTAVLVQTRGGPILAAGVD